MTTATLSLRELYQRCLGKAASLPSGHTEARNRLYETAERFRADHDAMYAAYDDFGPIGCRTDESWL